MRRAKRLTRQERRDRAAAALAEQKELAAIKTALASGNRWEHFTGIDFGVDASKMAFMDFEYQDVARDLGNSAVMYSHYDIESTQHALERYSKSGKAAVCAVIDSMVAQEVLHEEAPAPKDDPESVLLGALERAGRAREASESPTGRIRFPAPAGEYLAWICPNLDQRKADARHSECNDRLLSA